MIKRILYIAGIIILIFELITLQKISLSTKQVAFLAVGDTGTGEDIQYKLSYQMEKSCKNGCEAVYLLGDIIYPEGIKNISDKQLMSKFESPFSNLFLPFFITLGNHDYEGCIDCMIAYSTYSAKWRLPAKYYFRSYDGIVDTFVIDTNNFSEAQKTWLFQSIKDSKAVWKIVFAHHPLTSYDSRHNERENIFKNHIESVICNNIDLYLSGHDHGLMDLGNHCGVRLMISGGGSTPLGQFDKTDFPFSSATYGFLKLSVTKQKLRVEFWDLEGKQIHFWEKAR